ncbi:MAG: hypothetical protein Q4C41_00430 [Eggerthellaceae bacterium]|nr:hypothetical protein [Eggerthellaceae bacterium]
MEEVKMDALESEPELDEAARELAEHNALADVFDAVRELSADGQLTEPTDWTAWGLVPAHLTADEFEMMVYEYLQNYLGEHRSERAAEKAAERARASTVKSATRAVGISPFVAKRKAEQEAAAAEAEAEGARVAEAAPARGTEAASAAVAAAATSATVARPADEAASAAAAPDAAPDADNPFPGLRIPEGYKLVELEGEYVLVEDENAAPVERTIDCKNIVVLEGKRSYYLYDEKLMTDTYAHWAFLAAEDDPLMTFVDCVREEGRVYPRPLAADDLHNPPFRMSAAMVQQTWEQVEASGDYPDICRTVASNGDVYYYSTLYLSDTLAGSLAEYHAVERYRNV